MKWIKPKLGQEKTRRFFALFPVSVLVNGAWEWRWLEWVKIKCRYKYDVDGPFWDKIAYID